MKRGSLIIVFLASALLKGYAQLTVSTVKQRFSAYQAALPKVKLHLSFNQNKFFPGDTVFFKAYFLTEELTGIAGKQLIDFNLIDSRGQVKLHFLFSVNDGIGYNQFPIHDTLQAGIYLVTAHSNWMRNFGPEFIFKKEIIVVRRNTIEPELPSKVIAVPEGGHLINGIPNRIGIVTHQPGVVVQVMDYGGREIDRVTTDRSGTASIIFTPAESISYFLRVAGNSGQVPLPAGQDDGFGLLLTFAEQNDPLRIRIESPPNSTLRDQDNMLVVTSRGKIYHTANFRPGQQSFVELEISKDKLPEGVGHISLLNSTRELIASRDFYRQETVRIDAKVEAGKNQFQTREKVRLEISLATNNGQPVQGEFSINVLNSALFNQEREFSLTDELTIFPSGDRKFWIDRSDSNWLSSLDNYLITATEDIPWQDIFSKEIKMPKFQFTTGIQKSGRVYLSDSLKPVPDFMQIMLYFQNNRGRYQTTVDNGKIFITIPDQFGCDELLYFAETYFYLSGVKRGEEVPDIRVKWDDTSIQLPWAQLGRETESPDVYATFAANRRLIDRSYGFYTSTNKQGSSDKLSDWEDEICEADIVVNVKDYSLFPTMAEFVKEVIPSLQHRKMKKKNSIRVFLPDIMAAMATGGPLYIIDGTATKNTDYFLSLKPTDLLAVKIVNDPKKLLPLGMMGKNGIVIVQTKKGNVREPLQDSSRLIEGLNRPIDFHKSDYSTTQYFHAPNFRSTLHWSPTIKTDSSGKATVEFFCSDDVGKVNIHIEGLTTGGRPFSFDRNINLVVGPQEQ